MSPRKLILSMKIDYIASKASSEESLVKISEPTHIMTDSERLSKIIEKRCIMQTNFVQAMCDRHDSNLALRRSTMSSNLFLFLILLQIKPEKIDSATLGKNRSTSTTSIQLGSKLRYFPIFCLSLIPE